MSDDTDERLTTNLDRLAALLEEENAALEAVDYRQAAIFAEQKRVLLADLRRARRDMPACPILSKPLKEASARVETLLERNALSLERAIRVQRRVISVFGRQAVRHARGGNYGKTGSLDPSRPQRPMAFVARA